MLNLMHCIKKFYQSMNNSNVHILFICKAIEVFTSRAIQMLVARARLLKEHTNRDNRLK